MSHHPRPTGPICGYRPPDKKNVRSHRWVDEQLDEMRARLLTKIEGQAKRIVRGMQVGDSVQFTCTFDDPKGLIGRAEAARSQP